jgi:ankyrin repeat protein
MWDRLLKNGTLDANEAFSGKTPLMYALGRRRYDIASVLIENGALVDAVLGTTDELTALWHAANKGM